MKKPRRDSHRTQTGHAKKHAHRSDKEKRTEQKSRLIGIIRTTGRGMGYVPLPDGTGEVVIQPEFLNTALNGDEVEVQITGRHFEVRRSRKHSSQSQEGGFSQLAGQIVNVIKRAKRHFVGVLTRKEDHWWIMTDDKKMYVNIFVPNADSAHEGKKVLAEITQWHKHEAFPTGEIISVIGAKGDHETEIQAIILDRGIDTVFPDDVMREAEMLEKDEKPLKHDEITRRKDFRDTFTFTIDPADAKDFDDALSFKKLANGLYEVGVHIADVSYYVRENTALDAEAANRAFSVYLVDRTIPMLPEVLSNDLCSLNPAEDKLAFSAVFVLDDNGKVHDQWFGRTVIHSSQRFSYESAQAVLDKKSGEYYEELATLNTIAKKLQYENYKKGAIDFQTEEVKFKLDENGKPLGVYKKERLDTHKLIEEYMLLANREVAEFIFTFQKSKLGSASIYRIHDIPDSERIEELALFLKALGYHLPVKQGIVSSRDINKLLQEISGKPEETLIKTATIRSMAKAIYSTKNIGHYGLGFKYYTHFTSPIRRYPDLMVHRILGNILEKNENKVKNEFKYFERISSHSTEKEIAAAEAERASIKYKQVEYMSAHIGEEFSGIISGITDWGMFVEEEQTKCEGLVPLRDMTDDYYFFNKKSYSLEGEKTKKKYRLGDRVTFKVLKADLDAKTLDYRII